MAFEDEREINEDELDFVKEPDLDTLDAEIDLEDEPDIKEEEEGLLNFSFGGSQLLD
ncbi:MAG: hypothetical protein PHS95_00850 [Candidatus Pacebacteria bacterium]|nr:hypothetical protein [Candidatus Paceibacterota bacterium]